MTDRDTTPAQINNEQSAMKRKDVRDFSKYPDHVLEIALRIVREQTRKPAVR
jgi:hypothetical protein